jgi:hypothetical protein
MSVDRTRVSVENKQQKSEGCEEEKECFWGIPAVYETRGGSPASRHFGVHDRPGTRLANSIAAPCDLRLRQGCIAN